MKSYTDIEQSRKLAEKLPIESADMYYCYGMDIHTKVWSFDDTPTIIDNSNQIDVDYDIPCWSLAALLEALPDELEDNHFLTLLKEKDEYCCCYEDINGNSFTHVFAGNAIDACYEMILKLHELKML